MNTNIPWLLRLLFGDGGTGPWIAWARCPFSPSDVDEYEDIVGEDEDEEENSNSNSESANTNEGEGN
jgi:hypothetical protein